MKERIAEEIFITVYKWGMFGIKVDAKSQTYKKLINALLKTVKNK